MGKPKLCVEISGGMSRMEGATFFDQNFLQFIRYAMKQRNVGYDQARSHSEGAGAAEVA